MVSGFPDLAPVSNIVWANIPYAYTSIYTSDAGTAELECKKEEVKEEVKVIKIILMTC